MQLYRRVGGSGGGGERGVPAGEDDLLDNRALTVCTYDLRGAVRGLIVLDLVLVEGFEMLAIDAANFVAEFFVLDVNVEGGILFEEKEKEGMLLPMCKKQFIPYRDWHQI